MFTCAFATSARRRRPRNTARAQRNVCACCRCVCVRAGKSPRTRRYAHALHDNQLQTRSQVPAHLDACHRAVPHAWPAPPSARAATRRTRSRPGTSRCGSARACRAGTAETESRQRNRFHKSHDGQSRCSCSRCVARARLTPWRPACQRLRCVARPAGVCAKCTNTSHRTNTPTSPSAAASARYALAQDQHFFKLGARLLDAALSHERCGGGGRRR